MRGNFVTRRFAIRLFFSISANLDGGRPRPGNLQSFVAVECSSVGGLLVDFHPRRRVDDYVDYQKENDTRAEQG